MSDEIKKGNSLSSIKLSAYTPHNYVDVINKQKGWVEYGVDNDYPDYLIDLYNESPTHHALCNSLAYWIFGSGMQSPELAKLDWNETLLKLCLEVKIHGYCFIEVVWAGSSIAKIEHMPSELIRCGIRDGREIDHFWYSDDWQNTRKHRPIEMHTFSADPKIVAMYPNQILYIRPFSPGSFYYAKPDYLGAVEYCELEKRIGTFHNSSIKNGMAPSYIITMRNGTPDDETKRVNEGVIRNTLAGENNTGNILMLYVDPGTEPAEITTVQLSDADKQYQFLSSECIDKIMIGHRVVSGLLFGVDKATGFGSNAEEMTQAEEIMRYRLLEPMRAFMEASLKPLFQAVGLTIMPEWKDREDDTTPDVEQSFTGIQISSAIDIVSRVNAKELTKEQGSILIEQMLGFTPEIARNVFSTVPENTPPSTQLSAHDHDLPDFVADYLESKGEVIDEEEWELIDARPEDYSNSLEGALKLASVPSSNPNGLSEQDNELFKVRYGYAPRRTNNSRQFCIKMVAANKVYRKEDIIAAGDRAVNPGFGIDGASTYDIWLYKGGPWCSHYWERKIYMRKNNKKISVNEARKIINELAPSKRDDVRPPINDPKVAQLPRDMQDHGYYNPPN